MRENNRRRFQILILLLCVLAIALSLVFASSTIRSMARLNSPASLRMTDVSDDFQIRQGDGISMFALYAPNGYLFKTGGSHEEGAREFLRRDPTVKKETNGMSTMILKEGKSEFTLLPKNFSENFRFTRSSRDQNEPYLIKMARDLGKEHYYYNQLIQGIPVLGAEVGVHIKNSNEVYAFIGTTVTNEDITQEKISSDQAAQIAKNKAKETASAPIALSVGHTEKQIVNKKLLGIADDSTNYSTLAVDIVGDTSAEFAHRYYVDLEHGLIVFDENLVEEALQREIRYCVADGLCDSTIRREGQPPLSQSVVNFTYDTLGDVYLYYRSNFNRDSYDNLGGVLSAKVNFHSITSFCPNASWGEGSMLFCEGMATKDIIAHELTHGVTEATAHLIYANESGALNESMSDILAASIDWNWTIGEDSIVGAMRYMGDPQRGNPPQPGNLFSANYYCGGIQNDSIHINSGVLNYAFYLMTAGGNFNGCFMLPLGRAITVPIIYRALTTYLHQTSNFSDAYRDINIACDELYGGNSQECIAVRNSMKAVEMDQQTDGTQDAPYCRGIEPTRPKCLLPLVTGVPILPSAMPLNTVIPIMTETPRVTVIILPTPTSGVPMPGGRGLVVVQDTEVDTGLPVYGANIRDKNTCELTGIVLYPGDRGTSLAGPYVYPQCAELGADQGERDSVRFNGQEGLVWSKFLAPVSSEEPVPPTRTSPLPTNPPPSSCSGDTCADCVLQNRTDILPFYKQNGWDTSCRNYSSIVDNWCQIDRGSCDSVKRGVCAYYCSSFSSGICSGNACADCVLRSRTDILPFYQKNGWDLSCSRQQSIVANWCQIDPQGCSTVKSTTCAAMCL